jgi:hypothetical protein
MTMTGQSRLVAKKFEASAAPIDSLHNQPISFIMPVIEFFGQD